MIEISKKIEGWQNLVPTLTLPEAELLTLDGEIKRIDHVVAVKAIKTGDFSRSNRVSRELSAQFQELPKIPQYLSAKQKLEGGNSHS